MSTKNLDTLIAAADEKAAAARKKARDLRAKKRAAERAAADAAALELGRVFGPAADTGRDDFIAAVKTYIAERWPTPAPAPAAPEGVPHERH